MEHTDRFDAAQFDRPLEPERDGSSARILWVVLALAILAGAVLAWYFWKERQAPVPVVAAPAVEAPPAPAPAVQPPLEPTVRHPIESIPRAAAPAAPQPLPALTESDASLRESLAGLLSAPSFDQLFYPVRLVRRVVATVDNLPRKSLSVDLRPAKPLEGTLATVGPDEARQISLDNARRYAPYVHAFAAMDSQRLIAIYTHYYPLFQQAYRELGYPNGYFNDRLVDVIDNLLAAPVVEGPVALTQPRVLYDFADPALQSLSAGQKIMVRMGPENAQQVKAKLRDIRRLVVGQKALASH
jgi:hypothetical protein